jgi:hypothetical protein
MKPIKTVYECPYCEFKSEKFDDVARCHGMCHLASLIDEEVIENNPEWTPPLPFYQFKNWSKGDRREFVNLIDRFARKHYSYLTETTYAKDLLDKSSV